MCSAAFEQSIFSLVSGLWTHRLFDKTNPNPQFSAKKQGVPNANEQNKAKCVLLYTYVLIFLHTCIVQNKPKSTPKGVAPASEPESSFVKTNPK